MSSSGLWFEAGTAAPAVVCRKLAEIGFRRHAFAVRQPEVDVRVEREEAVARLAPCHGRLQSELGMAARSTHVAQQVHGDVVAVIPKGKYGAASRVIHAGADALITNDENVCLGIYTADCCAVFIVDPVSRAVALVHSGAKGTALRIVSKALESMHRHFGCQVSQLVVALSPCIRPPLYEVDFARCIFDECREAGVAQIWDGGECTGRDTALYYSYRMERGLTGRMLALLGS